MAGENLHTLMIRFGCCDCCEGILRPGLFLCTLALESVDATSVFSARTTRHTLTSWDPSNNHRLDCHSPPRKNASTQAPKADTHSASRARFVSDGEGQRKARFGPEVKKDPRDRSRPLGCCKKRRYEFKSRWRGESGEEGECGSGCKREGNRTTRE
jgi:hypothetical protein